jgi:hypothetical protein
MVDSSLTELHPRLQVITPEREVLLEDGTWRRLGELEALPIGAGLPMPRDALRAIAVALADYFGNELPSQAEVAVLREVLAKEQARVDTVLERARL